MPLLTEWVGQMRRDAVLSLALSQAPSRVLGAERGLHFPAALHVGLSRRGRTSKAGLAHAGVGGEGAARGSSVHAGLLGGPGSVFLAMEWGC